MYSLRRRLKSLKGFVVKRGLARRRLTHITVLTSRIAVGAPTALEERPGGGITEKRRRNVKGGVPVVLLDYMWMKGKKGDGQDDVKGSPILVAHCREAKVTWSRVLLKKDVDPY